MKDKHKLKAEKKPREQSHMFRNSAYMLGRIWDASHSKVIGQFAAMTTISFFYNVVYAIWFLKATVSAIERGADYGEYMTILLAFVACKLFSEILQYWYFYKANEIQNIKIERYLNNLLFNQAQRIELACYETPDFYNKFKRASDYVQKKKYREFMGDITWAFSAVIDAVAIIAYIVSVDAWLLLVAVCPLISAAIKKIKNQQSFKKDKEMTPNERSKDYVRRTVFLKDYAKEIRISGVYTVLQKRFTDAVNANIVAIRRYGWRFVLLNDASELIDGVLPMIGSLLYCCYRFIVRKDLAISDFSVLVVAVTRLKIMLGEISGDLSDLHENCLYVQNVRDFLEYTPKMPTNDRETPALQSIEFRNVGFGYVGSDENVLNGVSFTLNKGEKIAVVGHNGAGKSTIAKLMMRLYDVSEGQILWNGTDIREYDPESYRSRYATVFQDYQMFSLSVAENVLMRGFSEDDREAVEDALTKSGVMEKVASLPDGISTMLTKEFDDEGAVLSGGEAQKVAIARLFAKDFDLAILDEPSSALDPIAEYKMYESLIAATENKTVVYISHRLSSAVLSDRVLVFDGGRLIEQGSHRALMASGGKYAEMFTLQASNYQGEDEAV